VAIPKLEALAKEGEEGRKAIAEYTRYGAVVLGFLQATAFYFGLAQAVNERNVLSFITITLTFTAGTAFLMWLGEQITEYGIGNGIFLAYLCRYCIKRTQGNTLSVGSVQVGKTG